MSRYRHPRDVLPCRPLEARVLLTPPPEASCTHSIVVYCLCQYFTTPEKEMLRSSTAWRTVILIRSAQRHISSMRPATTTISPPATKPRMTRRQFLLSELQPRILIQMRIRHRVILSRAPVASKCRRYTRLPLRKMIPSERMRLY